MLIQTFSVVIPVFRGGEGLRHTVSELCQISTVVLSDSAQLHLAEIVLVDDNPLLGMQNRDLLGDLQQRDPRIQIVWLAANFGQHPATVAGIVSTNSDWVVTMDEDGQHDPGAIASMVRRAAAQDRPLVYAKPTNPPPHGMLRNSASRATKRLFRVLSGSDTDFHSFRLIEGEVARSACAYVGENVYLDVALLWSCGTAASCPVAMRDEGSPSAYSLRRLASHFWRMVVSSGTTPLRFVAAVGFMTAFCGLITAGIVAYRRLVGDFLAPGWTSVMIAMLILVGGLYLSLAVLAEYVGFAVRNSIGKPVYLKVSPPQTRALWRLKRALELVDQ